MVRRFSPIGLALALAVVGTGAVVAHARTDARPGEARAAVAVPMAAEPTAEPVAEPVAAPALTVPAGKLAISVELKEARQVAGYVQPGSEVAVFATATDGTKATRLLLMRVPVLAIGTAGDAASQPKRGPLVTFAVVQKDAERLIHAAHADALYLALVTAGSTLRFGSGVDDQTLFP